MGRQMNRPSSAPATRPGAGAVAQARVVGRAVGGADAERAEYRPRHRPGSGAARGGAPRRDRGTSASRRRKEIVSEYMRVHVDPVMREMITHLLLAQPSDVAGAMLAYLRAARDGAAPGGSPGADAARRVSRADRVYMVREISPLLTEVLSDVVRARPRAPVDFIIAWLASRADAAPPPDADAPLPSVRGKLRDAVTFDAALAAGGAPAATAPAVAAPEPEAPEPEPAAVAAPAPEPEPAAPAALASKTIFVLGDVGSGKTTLLQAMRGDVEPNPRPSSGFRKYDVGHAARDGAATKLRLYDVSGKAKSRRNWVSYFNDCHAVLFVVDCAEPLDRARECFDFCFRPPADAISDDDARRGYLRGKPVLILANKQDAPGAAEPDAVAAALDLDGYQAACAGAFGAVHVAVCPVVGDPRKVGGDPALDPRVERALDWLAARVDDDGAALVSRVETETAAAAAWDREQLLKKERRVYRKVLRKAWPRDGGEPEECFDAAEGAEFIAAELGCAADALPPPAAALAALVNYQKLALQMIGNFKNPINLKKRDPMSWDEIDAYVRARYDEKWDPAWVAKDLADDPTNRKRGGDAAP